MHCIIESTFARIVLFIDLTLHQGASFCAICIHSFVYFCLCLTITVLATIKNTTILFVCPSKSLHKQCFSWVHLQVPREKKNNAYEKFWRDKQRVLWYF